MIDMLVYSEYASKINQYHGRSDALDVFQPGSLNGSWLWGQGLGYGSGTVGATASNQVVVSVLDWVMVSRWEKIAKLR